ncbi:MAG: hypothetical protein EOR51_22525 [Mesorhizobium sp.]|nr:MAG: hypothetical protein EOR51_22525 [Mesorhizobium sp.]
MSGFCRLLTSRPGEHEFGVGRSVHQQILWWRHDTKVMNLGAPLIVCLRLFLLPLVEAENDEQCWLPGGPWSKEKENALKIQA